MRSRDLIPGWTSPGTKLDAWGQIGADGQSVKRFRGDVFSRGERGPGPADPSEGGLGDDQSSHSS